ncbi:MULTISPECIES: CapA family protein [Giesbergeria]|uniref:CapA family protein n=1 Tax=Giesbergeria sinuosa TaxID=80883 RepID=A0ABV9QFF7_9BURK
MKWALALLLGIACGLARAETPSFSLVFAGDTTLDDAAGALIARGGDPLAHVAPLFAKADLRIANLECVVATTGEPGDKNYTFRAHPRVLPVLRRHLDGVTLANNHSGDYGRAAFAEMLGLLKAADLAQTGGGHNLGQAHTPWLVERAGLRIALFSYNEFMPRSFEADHDAPGIAWSEDEQVVADIERARQQHRADLVLVFMHWGWENELTANHRQRQLARLLMDAGADAIIGGHPHVTQDVELYQGKPIIYSVGNFVMKETDNERQRQAWVLRMTFDAQGASGFSTHPVRLDANGIPHPDHPHPSPCWQRGQHQPGWCMTPQH